MSDTDTDTPSRKFPVYDPNNEPVKFVTTVGNSGFINGVVNVTLLTTRYTPFQFPGPAEPNLIISALLRMDLKCAMDLHEALGSLIAANTEQPRAN